MAAGGHHAQAKDALVPCLQRADFLPGRRFQVKHFHRIPVQPASRLRRHHLPRPSFKKGSAQFLFQKVHLAGEGRLGNMELPGGTGNGALFYNGFKVSELP